MSPPIQYSGSITCAVTGSAAFTPKLVNGGAVSATVKVKAKLGGCVDATESGVTITKGTFVATSASTFANNCGAVLGGEALPTLSGTIKWKATGGTVDPSTVTVTSPSLFYDVDGNSISTTLPTSVSAGSFNSDDAAFGGLSSDKSGYLLDSKCEGRGLKSVAFGNKQGSHTGTVTIEEGGS
jgi:hypothetical protein